MRSSLHSVRHSVAALRAALLAPTPEALEAQVPELERAAQELSEVSPENDPAGLRALAAEVRAVQKLIGHGFEVQQTLVRLLAASLSGYRPDGEPSPLDAPGSISIAG
jgi:hypothetical protein